MTVRTRFAPSPTGYMHIGGARTALFAWLVARQADGEFILRIEDTDRNRLVDGSIEHIADSLRWMLDQPQASLAGFNTGDSPWNKGPNFDRLDSDEYDPYIQSSRVAHRDDQGYNIYDRYAQRLIDSGRAYTDPYTPEQIQAFREDAQSKKKAFLYRDYVTSDAIAQAGQWTPGCGKSLRLRSIPTAYTWHDAVMGELSTPDVVVDDIVLIKSDGYPTYNFAHIVDDDDMDITHVIRGQEFLASMPNYLNIYEALGINWRDITFASVPPIMNEQGNKKLSKRDGAKDLLNYRDEGYFSFAICNFLASLGWNDGTEQEFYRTSELVAKFSLDRIQRSGARFDERRAQWYNGQVIRDLYEHPSDYGVGSLYQLLQPISGKGSGFWPAAAAGASDEYKQSVLGLVYDRLKFLNDLGGKPRYADQPASDIVDMTSYFFATPARNDALVTGNKQLRKLTDDERRALIQAARDAFATLDPWTADSIQQCLNSLLETTGQKPGILFSLVRIVTTWAPFSPQLDRTLELLGQGHVLARLDSYLSQ